MMAETAEHRYGAEAVAAAIEDHRRVAKPGFCEDQVLALGFGSRGGETLDEFRYDEFRYVEPGESRRRLRGGCLQWCDLNF